MTAIYRFCGLALLLTVCLPGVSAFGQTMQQLRTCQGKTTTDADPIIRACSAFIETRHAVGGVPIPKRGLSGVLELRGNAYHKKAEFDRAIADYTEAIELKIPDALPELYSNRGNSHLLKKENERAFADFDEAIRLNPKYVQGYLARGYARLSDKDYAGAIANYQLALRFDPNNVIAHRQIDQVKLAAKLDERWTQYLQTIQNDHDYANWSGPPLEVSRNAK